jgi:hypothetical protein
MNKYGNRKVTRDGITFDSIRECQRYCELKLMQRAGVISDLRLQVPYELIPAQRIDGKVVERAVNYIADFVYMENGVTIVEDAKGCRTKEYILKRKMMLWRHGIRIREV